MLSADSKVSIFFLWAHGLVFAVLVLFGIGLDRVELESLQGMQPGYD